MSTRISGNLGINRVAPETVEPGDLTWVPPFTKEYLSPAQAMANSALFTLAHGLGVEPKGIQLIAQCKTADSGYSVGQRIMLSVSTGISGVAGSTPAVWADSTNIYVRCFNNGLAYMASSGAGGVALTHTKWDLYVRAWA